MMEEPSKRPHQVGDLIHRHLATLLKREINDPRLSKISIIEVRVTPDLRNARIYYTVLAPEVLPDVKKALIKGTGFLRQAVARAVALRYVPQFEFIYDDHLEKAEKLSDLISGL